jgi:hypothetical protein
VRDHLQDSDGLVDSVSDDLLVRFYPNSILLLADPSDLLAGVTEVGGGRGVRVDPESFVFRRPLQSRFLMSFGRRQQGRSLLHPIPESAVDEFASPGLLERIACLTLTLQLELRGVGSGFHFNYATLSQGERIRFVHGVPNGLFKVFCTDEPMERAAAAVNDDYHRQLAALRNATFSCIGAAGTMRLELRPGLDIVKFHPVSSTVVFPVLPVAGEVEIRNWITTKLRILNSSIGAIQFVSGGRVVEFVDDQTAREADDRYQNWLSRHPELADKRRKGVMNLNFQVDNNGQTLKHVLRNVMFLKINSFEATKTLCLYNVMFDSQLSGILSAAVPVVRIDVRPSADKCKVFVRNVPESQQRIVEQRVLSNVQACGQMNYQWEDCRKERTGMSHATFRNRRDAERAVQVLQSTAGV